VSGERRIATVLSAIVATIAGTTPMLTARACSTQAAAEAGRPGIPDGLRSSTVGADRLAVARIERPPLGLPPVPVPPENPTTVEKIRLGRTLFLDRRLSVNGTLSCAMCHIPEQGFAVNELRTAVGHEGTSLRRNAPTLLNVAYSAPFFHDGREPSLDLQPIDVLVNPDEMAMPSIGAVVSRVRSMPGYAGLFEEAFDSAPTIENIGQAIGTYLRSLLSAESPFDRWYYGGEDGAIDESARRGFDIFTLEAGCVRCHHIGADHALFTDGTFHDTGLGRFNTLERTRRRDSVVVELAPGVEVPVERSAIESVGEQPANDLGRFEVTGDPADRWRFKTPSLRNVALTAPYMHDGSFSTLDEVIAFYRQGGHFHEGIDPLIKPLELSAGDVNALVAFLESLTGDNVTELVEDARSEKIGNPQHPLPVSDAADMSLN
jgi:cytochrome c peroxidase